MKKEIQDIFNGIYNKSGINISNAFGLGLFTNLIFSNKSDVIKLSDQVGIANVITIINLNPILFWSSCVLGFFYCNSLIKEVHIITFRKFQMNAIPFILIYLLMIYIF